MRPAPDITFIATIADRDGWILEHVLAGETQALAERELRETLRHSGMTLLEIRRAPVESKPRLRNSADHKALALAAAVTLLVSVLARMIVF